MLRSRYGGFLLLMFMGEEQGGRTEQNTLVRDLMQAGLPAAFATISGPVWGPGAWEHTACACTSAIETGRETEHAVGWQPSASMHTHTGVSRTDELDCAASSRSIWHPGLLLGTDGGVWAMGGGGGVAGMNADRDTNTVLQPTMLA